MTKRTKRAQQRRGEQPLASGWWGRELTSVPFPGKDHLRGVGGDRQAPAEATSLVVVVDEVVVAVDDLDAAGLQAHDLAGPPSGVPQDPIDHPVHRLEIAGRDRPHPA